MNGSGGSSVSHAHDDALRASRVSAYSPLDVEVPAADVVHSLVVDHEGDIGVLHHRVRAKDGVVRLNDSGRDLRGRVDGELDLGLLAVVDREALEEERTETGTCATTEGVEDHETLETSAVVRKLADAVEDKVDDLLSDGVVATRVVVGGVLLTGDELLGVEQRAVGARADLVDDGRLEVEEDTAGDVLAGTGLAVNFNTLV